MPYRLPAVVVLALLMLGASDRMAVAQTGSTYDHPTIVEAESGLLGGDFVTQTDGDVTYIVIQTDGEGDAPGDTSRVATYDVTFPEANAYGLLARVRVGPSASSDDSFFYANRFGEKEANDADDWVLVERLRRAGFTDLGDPVHERGEAGNGVWKWINLSRHDFGDDPADFSVPSRRLTRMFQIGGREDGLEIDKFAFVNPTLFYTVEDLDAGNPGRLRLAGNTPLALGFDKFLGNIYSSAQTPDFTTYWNQVTPENAGKWGSVERSRDVMNWGPLDAAYALAKDNGLPFRFHVLVWGNQQPSWIESLPVNEQLEEIEEWFQAVAERYPDIDYVEVVNEPLHDPPNQAGNGGGNYIDALGGTGSTGWDWVVTSFRMARTFFPNAKLLINDFNIVNNSGNITQYLEIISLLQAENLIDGIGAQAHAFSTRGSAQAMIANLDRLAETGLPIQITELDIDGATDQVQLTDYQRIFPALWEHPAVEGITLWGWRPGLWRNSQRAFIIDENGAERPALQWLASYLATQITSAEDIPPLPHTLQLHGSYPNPFKQTATIAYELAEATPVTVTVHDVLGRHVQTLIDAFQLAGPHTVVFDGGQLPAGLYLGRVQAGAHQQTVTLTLVR
ncbi:MAG: endo-1,4-beta-xylanase [Bacteroidota bacterium]